MILGKLTRYLRTLKSKLTSSLSEENTMQWILIKLVFSYHYIVAFINSNWTNPHHIGPLDFYLDFIFYRKKSNNRARNKVTCALEFMNFLFPQDSLNTASVFVFTTQITRSDHYKFHIIEYLHIVDFHVI